MIIPLGTDRPLARTPIVTWSLVAVMVCVYVVLAALARLEPGRAAHVQASFALAGDSPVWYTFATYTLLHGGFLHLLGNVLILAVFGPNVEDRLGRAGFIGLFVVGGAFAGGLHVIFERAGVIGASGAIAAITGAYIVLFPHTLVRIFYFFILIGVTQIPAWMFIVFAIAKDIFMTGLGMSGNVATLAHLGGYALGLGLSAGLLATGLIKPEMYDLFSMARQAKRRADFRAAQRLAQERGLAPAALGESTTARAAAAAGGDDLALARADLARAVSAADWPAAEGAMARVLTCTGGPRAAASLVPKLQQDLANALFSRGNHPRAADAYESFLAAHGHDAGALRVRLMLALICARYLQQPARARAALEGLRNTPHTDDERSLLAQLKGELGLA